jgi:hypothetical protein
MWFIISKQFKLSPCHKKTHIMSKSSAEQEGRILLAISTLKKKEISSVREAACAYHVPETTLRRRLKGATYRLEKHPNGHKMTQNEEESLIQWIL